MNLILVGNMPYADSVAPDPKPKYLHSLSGATLSAHLYNSYIYLSAASVALRSDCADVCIWHMKNETRSRIRRNIS